MDTVQVPIGDPSEVPRPEILAVLDRLDQIIQATAGRYACVLMSLVCGVCQALDSSPSRPPSPRPLPLSLTLLLSVDELNALTTNVLEYDRYLKDCDPDGVTSKVRRALLICAPI